MQDNDTLEGLREEYRQAYAAFEDSVRASAPDIRPLRRAVQNFLDAGFPDKGIDLAERLCRIAEDYNFPLLILADANAILTSFLYASEPVPENLANAYDQATKTLSLFHSLPTPLSDNAKALQAKFCHKWALYLADNDSDTDEITGLYQEALSLYSQLVPHHSIILPPLAEVALRLGKLHIDNLQPDLAVPFLQDLSIYMEKARKEIPKLYDAVTAYRVWRMLVRASTECGMEKTAVISLRKTHETYASLLPSDAKAFALDAANARKDGVDFLKRGP